MIVCACHPTSDRDVDAIIDDGARTVEEISRRCGAGTGCGACLDELRERLQAKGGGGCHADADAHGSHADCGTNLVSAQSLIR